MRWPWPENDMKRAWKRRGNDVETTWKWHEDDRRMTWSWKEKVNWEDHEPENDMKMTWKWHENDVEMTWSRHQMTWHVHPIDSGWTPWSAKGTDWTDVESIANRSQIDRKLASFYAGSYIIRLMSFSCRFHGGVMAVWCRFLFAKFFPY